MKALVFVSTFFFALFGSVAFGQGPRPGTQLHINPVFANRQFCLDVRGGHPIEASPIILAPCQEVPSQIWTVTSTTNTASAVIGIGGLCMDVRGVNSTANGTAVQVWNCHFGENQRFVFQPDGRIVEVRSRKCLIPTAPQPGAPVVLDTCKNIPQEIFQVHR